jgi:hypothetical protein
MSQALLQPSDRRFSQWSGALASETFLRRRYFRDPALWGKDRLAEFMWSGQKNIMYSVRDNRRTAVASCHEIGKSFIAARLTCWWIDIHSPGKAIVVTSAPTARQVRTILWKEIGRAQSKGLAGRTNQTSWYITMPNGKEELVAFGMKPSDTDPAAFQGIHAEAVLVIFDESCGIPGDRAQATHSLWEAADSLIANDNSRFLAIGNPDDPQSYFADICKPGSGWNYLSISAWDSPNFSGEKIPESLKPLLIGRVYVEEKRRKWARDWVWTEDGKKVVPPEGKTVTDSNPLWQSKVLGVFPEISGEKSLIPLSWIRAAQTRELKPEGPNELGVDVGGGGDSSTIAHRLGPVVRIVHEDHNPNTMHTCGAVVTVRKETGATVAKIDRVGIGAGVSDRGKEMGEPFVGINVGEASNDPETFANLRAEYWWGIRERFESGDIDIDSDDDDLAAELCSIRFDRNSRGQIVIESKSQASSRGIPSPNRGDAVMLAFAKPRAVPKGGLVW